MDILILGKSQRLAAVFRPEYMVSLGGEIDLQRRNDILFVITNYDILYIFLPSLCFYCLYHTHFRGIVQAKNQSRPSSFAVMVWRMGFHSTFIKSAAKLMGI